MVGDRDHRGVGGLVIVPYHEACVLEPEGGVGRHPSRITLLPVESDVAEHDGIVPHGLDVPDPLVEAPGASVDMDIPAVLREGTRPPVELEWLPGGPARDAADGSSKTAVAPLVLLDGIVPEDHVDYPAAVVQAEGLQGGPVGDDADLDEGVLQGDPLHLCAVLRVSEIRYLRGHAITIGA